MYRVPLTHSYRRIWGYFRKGTPFVTSTSASALVQQTWEGFLGVLLSQVLLARAQTGLSGEEKAKVNPDLALDRGHPCSSVRSSGGRPTLCVYGTNWRHAHSFCTEYRVFC